MTDTECFGRMTINILRSAAFSFELILRYGVKVISYINRWEHSFNSACDAGITPSIVIVVSNALVRLVFTAFNDERFAISRPDGYGVEVRDFRVFARRIEVGPSILL